MTIDRETIETLRDEPELLAIADAVQSAGQLGPVPASRRSRRRPVRIAAVALAVAAAIGIVLSSPWESSAPSLVDRALAAVGNKPVTHVVERISVGERINLRTDKSSPGQRDLEIWYDQHTRVFRAVARLDGRVINRLVAKGNFGLGIYDPFLVASLYRKALKEGKLHQTGRTVIRGRRAIVVEYRTRGVVTRAYLDADTYRLLRTQFFVGRHLGYEIDVLRFETVSRAVAKLPATAPPPSLGGSASTSFGTSGLPYPGVQLTRGLRAARTAFGKPALWPGRSVQGHRVIAAQIATETDQSDHRTVRGRKLAIDYGPRTSFGDAYLDVQEAPAASPLWSVGSVYAPPTGYLDLSSEETSSDGNHERMQWTGTMTKDGFTIQLTSWSRSTLIAAARAMRPVP
jgi:hypothetical protein